MGGYARTDPKVYVVAWDEDALLKIGASSKQRWRTFMLRGARLVALFPDDFSDGRYPGELDYHRAALSFAGRAFETRDEAKRYLGSSGGGWLECYRIPRASTPEQFLARCLSIMPEHHAQAVLKHMQRTKKNELALTQM